MPLCIFKEDDRSSFKISVTFSQTACNSDQTWAHMNVPVDTKFINVQFYFRNLGDEKYKPQSENKWPRNGQINKI